MTVRLALFSIALAVGLLSGMSARAASHQDAPTQTRSALPATTSCGAGLVLPARPSHEPAAGPHPRSYTTHEGVHITLLPVSGNAQLSAVAGTTVAWVSDENTSAAAKLYLANTRSFHPRLIATGAPCGSFGDLRLSPQWLVWSTPVHNEPYYNLWAMNLASGRRILVARQAVPRRFPCGGIGCQPLPAFSLNGNTLVWTDIALGHPLTSITSRIYLRQLPAGRTRLIVSTSGICTMNAVPQIAGSTLVWLRFLWTVRSGMCDTVVRKDVRFLDLRSGAQRVLAGPMIGRPMTNGWAVSWLKGQCFLSCYQGTLTLLHLRSGDRRVLENLHAKEQTMSGTVLLWFSQDARGNGEMKALDLLNGKLYLLATEFESAPPGAPTLRSPGWGWGKEVIWTQETFPTNASSAPQYYLAVARVP